MSTTTSRDPMARVMSVLASSTLGTLVGLVGLVIPAMAWVFEHADLRALLVAQTAVVVALTANLLWLRKAHLTLPRANSPKSMDDAHYYDLVRTELESELISEYGEIANGHLRVYASEVPRLSVLLVETLTRSTSQPKRILAADLTTNPSLLTQRREYLAANRLFIESGGQIDRLFIVREEDLVRADFARPLLELVGRHRQLNVNCGLAVRERLRAEQAVDYVVFAAAAVLVEEEQGDADYNRGRSSVHFKDISPWQRRFASVWGQGSDSAPTALRAYEAVVQPMLDAGTWDTARARGAVEPL